MKSFILPRIQTASYFIKPRKFPSFRTPISFSQHDFSYTVWRSVPRALTVQLFPITTIFTETVPWCVKTSVSNNVNISSLISIQQLRRYAKGAIVKDKRGKGGKPKVLLSEEELDEVISTGAMNNLMQNILDKLKVDFVNTLSVRNSGSIETLPIAVEGDSFPLNEIAQIFRKNPELVVINMANFPEGLKPVLEALNTCGMNINPQQDGTMIYVPLPKVTREHRQSLAGSAKTLFNKAKLDLKELQNRFTKEARKQNDVLSEDLIFNASENIRYTCDNYVLEAEKLLKIKEKELLGE